MSELDDVFQHEPHKCHLQIKNRLVTHTFFPHSNSLGFWRATKLYETGRNYSYNFWQASRKCLDMGVSKPPEGARGILNKPGVNPYVTRVSWSQNCSRILEISGSISPSYALLMFFRCIFSAFVHSFFSCLGYFTYSQLKNTPWWEALPEQVGFWEWMNSWGIAEPCL